MKKIALTILTALTLNLALFCISGTALAADNTTSTSPAKNDSIMDYNMQFHVKENLKLGLDKETNAENQEMSYFKTGEATPFVAYATKIIEYATYIIGSIAMILIMVAGFMFMVSQGNQQKLDEAKDVFKYAVIGLVIVFLSYIITIFAQSIFASAT